MKEKWISPRAMIGIVTEAAPKPRMALDFEVRIEMCLKVRQGIWSV